MKKSIWISLMMFALMFTITGVALAEGDTETTSTVGSNVWNWVLTVGLGSVAAIFPAIWKRVKTISLKVADLVILVMDELDNVKTQIIELKTAGRSLIAYYKEAIEDDVLSKDEQAKFVVKFEELMDELDDVPTALKTAVTTIRDYVKTWRSGATT